MHVAGGILSMDYSAIKKDISKLNRAISSDRKKKIGFENDLEALEKERNSTESQFRINRLRKEQQAKVKYKEQQMLPYEQKRAEVENEIAQLKQEYDEAVSELTEQNLMEECSDRQSILAEVKEASDKLRTLIVSILGERFYNELEAQMATTTLVEDPERLVEIVGYFNSCEMQIEKISKHHGKITKIVNKLQSLIAGVDVTKITIDSAISYAVVVLVVVLTLLGFKYVYPIYLMLLVVGVVYDLKRHYVINKIMMVQKAVKDNVGSIEQMLKQEVLQELETRKHECDEMLRVESSRLNEELEKIENQIAQAALAADNSFAFNDAEVLMEHERMLASQDAKEAKINDEITRLEASIRNNQILLEEKKKLLNSELLKVQALYLDPEKIGDSYEFDTKFIQNVNGDKIEYFDHPETSSMFLYDEFEHAVQFIRLIIFQLRIKLNPFAFTVDVYDPITIGRDLVNFKPENKKDSPSINALYRAITTESGFNEEVEKYKEELEKRTVIILKEYGSIVEYNRFMLSIESLTESYRFIFMINPSVNVLTNANFKQILAVGGSVGIFFHIFMDIEKFYKLREQALSVIESIDKIWLLDRSGAKSRAKDWVETQLEERMSQK